MIILTVINLLSNNYNLLNNIIITKMYIGERQNRKVIIYYLSDLCLEKWIT